MGPQAPDMNLPDWAVSDDIVEGLIPDYGFLSNYMEYMADCTDAPLIYHLGSALAMMTTACPYCDVLEISKEGTNIQPLILWIALIGVSGDRKSTAMSGAIRLLERFRSITSEKQATLTLDGSIEAWHDHLVKNPNTLGYRDELSMLFDARQKGYLKNLIPWLLELYSGDQKIRMLKTTKVNNDGIKESDEKQIIIERPRVSLLGGIPPDVLVQKATAGDWASGFLARFKFFGGMRETWKMAQTRDQVKETELCRWLSRVAWRSRGHIVVSRELSNMLAEWVWSNVELPRRRREEHQDLLSQYTRFQEFAIRVCAIYAISRQFNPQLADDGKIPVDKNDMTLVIRLLEALRGSSRALFTCTQNTADRKESQEILNCINSRKDQGISRPELVDMFPQFSRATIYRRIEELKQINLIEERRGTSTKSRRIVLMYYPPSAPK